jgi:hypothetical protein
MGYTLHSIIKRKDTDLSWEEYSAIYTMDFDVYLWPRLLMLAHSYGWRPMGTLPPKPFPGEQPVQWNGSYTAVCEGQTVTASDAATLADALEKSLIDISDHECKEPKKIKISTIVEAELHVKKSCDPTVMMILAVGLFDPSRVLVVHNPDLTLLEYFSGADKQQVIDFIRFCRRGAFKIS